MRILRTYRKNIRREIKNSFSRFIAIFAIVALGTGFLAGLFATEPDMCETIDDYFDKENLHDVRLISTLGFSEEDVSAVRETADVLEVMPAYTLDAMAKTSFDSELCLRLHSLPDGAKQEDLINSFELSEGRMPQNASECIVETASTYSGVSIAVGDQLILDADTDNMKETVYTVVGLARSARYFSMEKETTTVGSGFINLFVYLPESAFAMEAYPEIYLTVAGAKLQNTFDDAYWELVDPVTQALEDLSDERSALRYEEIYADAKREIDDAWEKYNAEKADADQKLADAAAELSDAEKEIAEGQQRLSDGKAEYESGLADYEQAKRDYDREIAAAQKKLSDAKEQIDENESKLSDAKKTLDASKKTLDETRAALDQQADELAQGKAQYAENLAAYEQQKAQFDALPAEYQTDEQREALAQAKAALDAAKASLDTAETTLAGYEAAYQSGYAEYASGLAEYNAGVKALKSAKEQYSSGVNELEQSQREGGRQLSDAKAELDAAAEEIAENEQKLADAKAQYEDGLREYEEESQSAQEEFADAKTEIEEAEQELEDLEECEWYVLDRNSCASFVSFDSNAEKIAAIARVFPIFFFLVAALVIITTMTRMVEEQRIQIGTLKSLGYTNGAIMVKYFTYSGIAVVLGCVVGLSIGFVLFPTVIYNAYSLMYYLPPLQCKFRWGLAVIASLAASVCTFGATYSACRVSLSEKTASLLLPKTPKAGKRILLEHVTFLWKRMKFTQKVTARNLFRYKKRFFMTVIGICGCTALLLTGFGLRDSISDIVELQYGSIMLEDFTVTVEEEEDIAPGSPLADYLEGHELISAYYRNSQQNAKLIDADGEHQTVLLVPEQTDELASYISLRNRKTGETIPFEENSVVVTEKFAETYHISVGDTIRLKNADEKAAMLTVTGICENYIYSFIYVSPQIYESCYKKLPEYTSIFGVMAKDTEYDSEQICTEVLMLSGVRSISFVSVSKQAFADLLSNIDFIVIVLIISAGGLAFIVLYNLTNINIEERQKELATIKVLGFKNHEVAFYIYRETIILSVVGTIFGLIAGVFLHMFVVRTAEVDAVMFGRTIKVASYFYSAAMTLLFSFLVNLFMARKMRKISMVESMKANE